MHSPQEPILGVLLAGGPARRMGGGDKCLLPLGGKTLLQRCIDRSQPQVSNLILNANGNSLRFARTRLPVVADQTPAHPGPLAGIHVALQWLRTNEPNCQWLVSFACDAPFFPTDMVRKLYDSARQQNRLIATACSQQQSHPVFSLWHVSLLDNLNNVLAEEPATSLEDWLSNCENLTATVDFSHPQYDPFFTLDTPQDMQKADTLLPFIDK